MTSILISIALIHLGVLLCVAGLSKGLAIRAFETQLGSHGLLPAGVCRPVAWCVVGIELLLGISLLSGAYYRVTAVLAGLLFAAFLTYHIALRVFGAHEEPCGCLGETDRSQRGMSAEVAGVTVNGLVAAAVAVVGTDVSRYSGSTTAAIASIGVLTLFALAVRKRRFQTRLSDSWHAVQSSARWEGPESIVDNRVLS